MNDFPPNGTDASWPQVGVGTRSAEPPSREAAPKRALGSVWFLLDATSRRRSGRMALWGVVLALALGGIGLISYPVVTDVWASRIQNRLEREFQALAAEPGAPGGYMTRQHKVGSPITRLRIPKLGVNVIVVEGVTGNALRAGVGHYPGTPLPGSPVGNVAVAGHRTGFGEPFRHIDKLTEGDIIELQTPLGRFRYQVVGRPWVTDPNDWTVIDPTPEPMLTLTTCDPPHTSDRRLIVRARLLPS